MYSFQASKPFRFRDFVVATVALYLGFLEGEGGGETKNKVVDLWQL